MISFLGYLHFIFFWMDGFNCFDSRIVGFASPGGKIWENKQMYHVSWHAGYDPIYDWNGWCPSSLHALCCCGAFGYTECLFFWTLRGICKRFARELVQDRWHWGTPISLFQFISIVIGLFISLSRNIYALLHIVFWKGWNLIIQWP